jgi:8-oxo-dGTP diphosphatase
VLVDYLARHISGIPIAGDDAAEARFVALKDLGDYNLWDKTLQIIEAGHRRMSL